MFAFWTVWTLGFGCLELRLRSEEMDVKTHRVEQLIDDDEYDPKNEDEEDEEDVEEEEEDGVC